MPQYPHIGIEQAITVSDDTPTLKAIGCRQLRLSDNSHWVLPRQFRGNWTVGHSVVVEARASGYVMTNNNCNERSDAEFRGFLS